MKRLIATGLAPAEAARLALALPPPPPAATPEPTEETPADAPETGAPPTGTPRDRRTPRPAFLRPVCGGRQRPRWPGPRSCSTATRSPAWSRRRWPGTAWCGRGSGSCSPSSTPSAAARTTPAPAIDVEHLLSDRVQAALQRRARDVPPHEGRPVLLACAEDEQHSLPVHALAAALGEVGVQTRVLGARTPYAALAHAMRRLGPVVVFVWSQQAITGDTAPLAALPRLRPACRIVIGGLGWQGEPPPGVVRVSTLPEAVARITATLA
ncbi:MerR family transcriptional regulator [Nonomuraea ferruginea]